MGDDLLWAGPLIPRFQVLVGGGVDVSLEPAGSGPPAAQNPPAAWAHLGVTHSKPLR